MALLIDQHDPIPQIIPVDVRRIIQVFRITPDRDIEALVFQVVCHQEKRIHVAVILVSPDAEAAQFELDGQILPALRPDKGNDIGPIDVAELQGQKDGDADDDRKQYGNVNHDEVGKKEALAQRPVPELHGPHLVSLNLLLVYTLRVPKNRTKSKFFGESFCPL